MHHPDSEKASKAATKGAVVSNEDGSLPVLWASISTCTKRGLACRGSRCVSEKGHTAFFGAHCVREAKAGIFFKNVGLVPYVSKDKSNTGDACR